MNIVEVRENVLKFQEEAKKSLVAAKCERSKHPFGSPFYEEADKKCMHWLAVIEGFQRAAVSLQLLKLYKEDPEWEWKNRW